MLKQLTGAIRESFSPGASVLSYNNKGHALSGKWENYTQRLHLRKYQYENERATGKHLENVIPPIIATLSGFGAMSEFPTRFHEKNICH